MSIAIFTSIEAACRCVTGDTHRATTLSIQAMLLTGRHMFLPTQLEWLVCCKRALHRVGLHKGPFLQNDLVPIKAAAVHCMVSCTWIFVPLCPALVLLSWTGLYLDNLSLSWLRHHTSLACESKSSVSCLHTTTKCSAGVCYAEGCSRRGASLSRQFRC